MRTKEGITSHCEQLRTEQYYFDPMQQTANGANSAQNSTILQPLRTMIRSLDTLGEGPGSKNSLRNGVGGAYSLLEPDKEQLEGWAPEVEIISEQDLKRIEKQEDRESRMRKRRTR